MELVLGTMYFGTRTDEATSFAVLDRYVAAGGRILDTANCYAFWASGTGHGGQSETVLGRWLAANPGVREELTVATKVGVEPVDGGGVEGLSADVIGRECRRSLERLGVDRVDLYWAHGEDRSVPLAETVAAFGELVEEGLVGRLGVSNHPTWRVEQARALAAASGVAAYTALQLTTSYVGPRPGAPVPGKDHRFGFVSDETVDYLETHPDLELWVYSPLVQGSYDRADRPFPRRTTTRARPRGSPR
ncbi:aldo/keto reductase [Nocardioides anomalus]|uniref:aldo/keto reductase n=1 Tax=Nocardioides anomalus TaxID=2712223 RepID=UPI002E763B33|nr:aldo/keto reductase [Nocardioides anomalus]